MLTLNAALNNWEWHRGKCSGSPLEDVRGKVTDLVLLGLHNSPLSTPQFCSVPSRGGVAGASVMCSASQSSRTPLDASSVLALLVRDGERERERERERGGEGASERAGPVGEASSPACVSDRRTLARMPTAILQEQHCARIAEVGILTGERGRREREEREGGERKEEIGGVFGDRSVSCRLHVCSVNGGHPVACSALSPAARGMSPIVKKAGCFAPTLCHCKPACRDNTEPIIHNSGAEPRTTDRNMASAGLGSGRLPRFRALHAITIAGAVNRPPAVQGTQHQTPSPACTNPNPNPALMSSPWYRYQDDESLPPEHNFPRLTDEVRAPELVHVSEKNLSEIENVHGYVSHSHISPLKVSDLTASHAIAMRVRSLSLCLPLSPFVSLYCRLLRALSPFSLSCTSSNPSLSAAPHTQSHAIEDQAAVDKA
ncbi:hypothetical protein P4O66_000239 [Electrophorus voltai]|uniref:Disks large homologue 1 N-terminal PEST domain-containing protein n=1 Tax=Electrophorus voltai TaxID=2609070 RepID=A0AAD8ZIR1_9TELE|nr:hypothetical protein P4O66_000239 [Electrophorus voltai]